MRTVRAKSVTSPSSFVPICVDEVLSVLRLPTFSYSNTGKLMDRDGTTLARASPDSELEGHWCMAPNASNSILFLYPPDFLSVTVRSYTFVNSVGEWHRWYMTRFGV